MTDLRPIMPCKKLEINFKVLSAKWQSHVSALCPSETEPCAKFDLFYLISMTTGDVATTQTEVIVETKAMVH